SLVLAYSHCIAHGINMSDGFEQQDKAVKSGFWPLYRYDPRLADTGKNPLQLDSKDPSISFKDYAYGETRFKMLTKSKPEQAEDLAKLGQHDINVRWNYLKQLSEMNYAL
ncbi:MAG: hypothetical protein ACOCZE_07730, partial [Planctomycetota bacterium]